MRKLVKTYKLIFAVQSANGEKRTLLDIDGILQEAIKDCSLKYQVNLIRFKEQNQ